MMLEDEYVSLDIFKMIQASIVEENVKVCNAFNEHEYEGEWLHIGRLLSSMEANTSWSKEYTRIFLKKVYKYFLQGGYL